MYQSSTTSQDGLAEAIQLLSLSCRPSRAYQGYQPTLGQSFAEREEQPTHSVCSIAIQSTSLKNEKFPNFKFTLRFFSILEHGNL